MNPSPVCIGHTENYKTVKTLMKKYGISSFLVVTGQSVQDSPRLSNQNKKIIRGILTQRDINCFKFDDEIV
jgi:CBS domain-containing protein